MSGITRWLVVRGTLFLALFLATYTTGEPPGKAGDLPTGDYAGWAFLQSGPDLPVRWRCREEKGKRVVTVSLPHEGAYDLAAAYHTPANQGIRVALENLSFPASSSKMRSAELFA